MDEKGSRTDRTSRPVLEGAFAGLAYGTLLVAASVFAIGSFRPGELPVPYWNRIHHLRTDTFGILCLIVAVFSLTGVAYLRVNRKFEVTKDAQRAAVGPVLILIYAFAQALAIASSLLFAYLSINAITHPQTLAIHATHFLSWPTEGTLRVAALALLVVTSAVAWSSHIKINETSNSVNN